MYNNSLHVNPAVRNFWRNLKKNDSEFHVFKKNRNLVYFGDDLSRKSYEFVDNRIKNLNISFDHNKLALSFFSVLEKESGNEDALKELAINAVSEAFEIPKNILKAQLNTDDIDVNSTDEKTPDNDYNYEDLSQYLKDQINKRILLNCVSQGASIHAFYTMHHLVKTELEKIDEEIVSIYDEISVGTVFTYWKIDYSAFLQHLESMCLMVQGSAKVEYDEENNPSVIAKARTFVVLCQELVKGSMELISLNGLKDLSEEELKVIYAFADKRVDEPRYIQISSEIWRNLLALIKHHRDNGDKITIPELVMKIAQMNPKDSEDFFEFLLSGELEKSVNYINNNEGDDPYEDFE